MSWNITPYPRRSLLIAALAFTVLCLDVVVTEDCNLPNRDKIFQKSFCEGYEIAVYSVWTKMQCLDNCLRLPYCDKYIFNREENQNCKLLYTGDITSVPGAVSLTMTDGQCAPKNAITLRKFLLGIKGCPDLHRNDDSGITPLDSHKNVNGGK